jgi:hypothetical protein
MGSRADLHHAAVRFPPPTTPQTAPTVCAARSATTQLKPEIARVHDENLDVYGADKVWTQMKREGYPVARCTVERLMRRPASERRRRGRRSRRPPSPTRPSTDRPTSSTASSWRTVPTACGWRT